MVAGLLAGAAASAAAANDNIGRAGSEMIIVPYILSAPVLMLLPVIYIFLRRGLAFRKKLKWFLVLAALDLGSCVLLLLAFISSNLRDALFSPVLWIAAQIPGYVLAYTYQRAVRRQARSNDSVS